MSVTSTLNALGVFCRQQTGDEHTWNGNKHTYHWNLGRDADSGKQTNGVVRKLAGIDSSGKKIWVVAGSFKIDPTGNILRFTGLSRKIQKQLEQAQPITIPTETLITV